MSKTIEWTVTFHESWKVGEKRTDDDMCTVLFPHLVLSPTLLMSFLIVCPPLLLSFTSSHMLYALHLQAPMYVRIDLHVHALTRTYVPYPLSSAPKFPQFARYCGFAATHMCTYHVLWLSFVNSGPHLGVLCVGPLEWWLPSIQHCSTTAMLLLI